MKRLAIVADTYAEGHAFVRNRRTISGESFQPSVITPTTHPGAIAGITFDEVVRMTDADLDPRTEAYVKVRP